MNLKNFLSNIQLPYRGSCPKCGHKNTFSALLLDGNVIYNCFHASCNLKGRIHHDLTINDIKANSSTIWNSSVSILRNTSYIIPDHFTSPLQNPKALAFMRRWNLVNKYANGLELYYDPKQQRVVFPLRNSEKELKGATGRSIIGVNPRWYIYSRIDECPYTVQSLSNPGICILVEDVISALRLESLCSSISILGTNIGDTLYKYIDSYGFDKLGIALDDDATSKALKLQKQLSIFKPTFILPLVRDIKYYSNSELEELRKEYF